MIFHAQWVLVHFLCTKSSTLEAAEEPLSLLKYRNCNNNKKEEEKKGKMGLSELRKENSALKSFWNYLILLLSFLPNHILLEVRGIFATELNKDVMEHN